jgi:hypothetical protein
VTVGSGDDGNKDDAAINRNDAVIGVWWVRAWLHPQKVIRGNWNRTNREATQGKRSARYGWLVVVFVFVVVFDEKVMDGTRYRSVRVPG